MTQRSTTTNEERRDEIRRLRRMLTELGELAEHASLTGALERGAPAAIRRYNTVLQRLQELGAVPSSFGRLGDDVSFDEIKVESALVASYLKDDERGPLGGGPRGTNSSLHLVAGLAPFVDKHELLELLRAHEHEGESLDPDVVLSLAPFLPREEVARLVRHHLSELLGPPATPPEPARPQGAPQRPAPGDPGTGAGARDERDAQRRRLAELDARMDELLTQLRDDVSAEQRARLIDDVSRIGEERAALRRQLEPA